MSSNNARLDLLNTLCRICAKDCAHVSIPIFGEEGKKHNVIRKIQCCLPVANIREDDNFPKQICLTCLPKLDSCWNIFVTCKDAQVKIEKKLYALKNQNNCEVFTRTVEDRLSHLSESNPVSYGASAVISLVPATPPPSLPTLLAQPACQLPDPGETQVISQTVTTGPIVESVMGSVTFLPDPADPLPPTAEEVYPQALIKVPQNPATEQPVVYENRSMSASAPVPPPPRRRTPSVPVPRPMASDPVPVPRPSPNPLKRQNSEPPGGPQDKKLCIYCKKYFTDDIIDHHISLHLRQTFRTCLDCDKNFRSEEALERHRCGVNETIDLDADEEPIVV